MSTYIVGRSRRQIPRHGKDAILPRRALYAVEFTDLLHRIVFRADHCAACAISRTEHRPLAE